MTVDPTRQDDEGQPTQPRHDGKSGPELAGAAEKEVLGIVHLLDGEGEFAPAELYRTLSGLARLVAQLPEAVTRLAAAVTALADAGELTVEGGPFAGDPAGAVRTLADAVAQQILPAFATARTGLEAAQAAVSHASSSRTTQH